MNLPEEPRHARSRAHLQAPLREPPHPGRLLQKLFLQPMGLTQTEAARRLGVSRRRLHEVVHGLRRLTPDTAARCAMQFGCDVEFWLSMQAAHDGYHAWRRLSASQR